MARMAALALRESAGLTGIASDLDLTDLMRAVGLEEGPRLPWKLPIVGAMADSTVWLAEGLDRLWWRALTAYAVARRLLYGPGDACHFSATEAAAPGYLRASVCGGWLIVGETVQTPADLDDLGMLARWDLPLALASRWADVVRVDLDRERFWRESLQRRSRIREIEAQYGLAVGRVRVWTELEGSVIGVHGSTRPPSEQLREPDSTER